MLQMPPRPVLSLSDVVKTFPGVVALGGVSLKSSRAKCTRWSARMVPESRHSWR